MRNCLNPKKMAVNITIAIAIVVLAIWYDYVLLSHYFYLVGKGIYQYLSILPNLFKIPMMIGFTFMSISLVCDTNIVKNFNFLEYLFVYVVFPFLIINMWIAMFMG
jgi:hypothetical protein